MYNYIDVYHRYSIVQNIFTALKILHALPINFIPLPSIPDLLTDSVVLHFAECHIVGIKPYVEISN